MDAWFNGALIHILIDLGRRAGVLPTFANGSWRARELAVAADVNQRYLEEWLAAIASFGLVSVERAADGALIWCVREEFREALASGPGSRLPEAALVTGIAHQAMRLIDVFMNGGGLSYAQRDPYLAEAFASDGNANYESGLLSKVAPVIPGFEDALSAGCSVVDVGCGSGAVLRGLARAFPYSDFLGLDMSTESIAAANAHAVSDALTNLRFDVCTIEELPVAEHDFAMAFEVIHNLAHPSEALAHITRVLRPGGRFFMYETNATVDVAANLGLPWAGPIYTASLVSCLTVSLALDGEGWGAMWGIETAERQLEISGYSEIGHALVRDDPIHVVIWGTVK